jgi:hypothetical protein
MYRHLPMPSTYRININDSRKEGFLCGLVPEAIRKIRMTISSASNVVYLNQSHLIIIAATQIVRLIR